MLRGLERNDLMHPRTTLTEWDAQRLFAEAAAAIILIGTEYVQTSGQGEMELEPQVVTKALPEPALGNDADKVEAEIPAT